LQFREFSSASIFRLFQQNPPRAVTRGHDRRTKARETAKLHDCTKDEVMLDEVERIK
jgi:hypothetical protein